MQQHAQRRPVAAGSLLCIAAIVTVQDGAKHLTCKAACWHVLLLHRRRYPWPLLQPLLAHMMQEQLAKYEAEEHVEVGFNPTHSSHPLSVAAPKNAAPGTETVICSVLVRLHLLLLCTQVCLHQAHP